jgi:SAM-dependent methyltransferase
VNSSGDPERDAEAERVGRVYAAYRRSRRRHRAWAADNPGNQAIRAELLAALLEEAATAVASGGEVLDVGCGTGYWLEALAAAGVAPERLTGVDVLPARLEGAAARVPGASVRQADARDLPFEDGRFSVVLLFTVLSSLASREDVRRALSEARRVLRPSGTLLIYEPRLANLLNRRVRRIRDSDLDAAGLLPRNERQLTLLPALARGLGRQTRSLYPALAQVRVLRTHRLISHSVPESASVPPQATGARSSTTRGRGW